MAWEPSAHVSGMGTGAHGHSVVPIPVPMGTVWEPHLSGMGTKDGAHTIGMGAYGMGTKCPCQTKYLLFFNWIWSTHIALIQGASW